MSSNYIKDYKIVKELTNDNSGFAKWGFGKKNRQEFFIKEFLSPIWPDEDSPLSPAQRQEKIKECNEWTARKAQVYNAICAASNGNIVFPRDFFRDGSHFYMVTEKIDTASVPVDALQYLREDKLLVVLRVFAHCLAQLERVGVVHGDLKPDNFLIKETLTGMYTLKLIDFDSSYLQSCPPPPDEIQCDLTYMAPEVFLYMIGEEAKVGTKSDVFAAGLMFHQYLCGKLPSYPAEYDYVYEAALEGAELVINDAIPEKFAGIIRKMLAVDYDSRISAEELYGLLFFPGEQPAPAPIAVPKPNIPAAPPAAPRTAASYFRKASTDEW